ncbi:MAG TPA: phosphotransferase [Mycobacteriales bacterium]|nr:phosphotransferase [Mycobacteriales bacterium]
MVRADGGRLLAATREDVTYRPGHDVTVRLAATVRRGGAKVQEGWVVSAGGPSPDKALSLAGPAGVVAAWRVRDDPDLVGLRSALDGAAVQALLTALGLPADGLRLTLVSVRPRRRAVVEVRTSSSRLFLKCVPPRKAAALEARHRACRNAGIPAPKALAVDVDLGIVILSPLPGIALRSLLLVDEPNLPPASQVADVLAGFAQVDFALPARDPGRHARGHAALLRAVLPDERGRVDAQLARILAGPRVPGGVHGDFYDAQLLVEDGHLVGVVDVDGAGSGRPADDAGNLLAHLLVLRTLDVGGQAAGRWLPEAAAAVRPLHDPVELACSTAAALLGLATWPHSRLASDWIPRTRELLDLIDQVLAGDDVYSPPRG